MKQHLLLNDVHVGAVRSAGTTMTTRAEIKAYIQAAFLDIILAHQDKDLIINGDLFDGFEVDTGEVLEIYLNLNDWLKRNIERILHLVRGNHDIAKNSQRTSSFELLCQLLKANFGDRVQVYNHEFAHISSNIFVIPHCVNQDLFNIEIENAIEGIDDQGITSGYLLLHANYDNNFAVEADHSLNVSEEQARALTKAGWTLVFAHEHQARTCMSGKVIVTGNQWPTSVADCLAHGEAQKDGKKYAHVFTTEDDFISGTSKTTIEKIETWSADTDFKVLDWTDLQDTDARFIRVEGKAESGQSADVVNAVSRYRQRSKALVITNSVKIDGVAGIGEMTSLTMENLQKINVREALLEELTPEEQKVVINLLDGGNGHVEAEAAAPVVESAQSAVPEVA
jgi:hypothetical protein